VLEITVNVSQRILKNQARWLKLRSLLLGEGDAPAARLRRAGRRAAQGQLAPAPQPDKPAEPAVEASSSGTPQLTSNLQKAAYALQRLHESSPSPSGYTAYQIALFLREQNIDALRAEQLSWALATMVSQRLSPDRPFARRVRRGRYLPTEHTKELFA
jgi:hypothetical protein